MDGRESRDDLEAEIDRLYQQPLATFVAARNEAATRLKTRGDRLGAERVRSLAKPSVPAWAVNQVFWTARVEFDRAIEASRRLRARQHAAGPAAGAELRDAVRERREAMAAALAKAEVSLTRAGHAATAAVMQRVSATLEALSVEPEGATPLGRLEKEREPPGFEAFAHPASAAAADPRALAVPAEPPSRPAAPAPGREGEALVARAKAEVAARERAVDAATAETGAARARLEAAQTSADEAQRRLADAAQRAREAHEALARAASALDLARHALAEARRAPVAPEP